MLEIKGVTAGYGRTKVLHDVTVEIPTARAVSVMGHNGAGKTTLLRVATGLIPVMSGQVLIDGEDVTRMPPSKRVQRGLGYVPQGQQSFPQMTTLENLQLVARRQSDIDEVFDLFPVLKELLGRRAGLLDEPTEGIQPNIVADIERVIIDLTRRGDLSVLLVEQHVGFALRSTHTFYVLQSGRITITGEGGSAAIDTVRGAMAI